MDVKKVILVSVSVIALVVFVASMTNDLIKRNEKFQFQKVELKSKTIEIQQLSNKYDKLNDELQKANQDKNTSQQEMDKLQKEQEDLLRQKQSLESRLQAKLDKQKSIDNAAKQVASVGVSTASASTGDCVSYAQAAGITNSIGLELVSRENRSCDPCRYNDGSATGNSDCNYSGSSAYGIPQALPGSKMATAGADWRTNPVTQLKWMQSYVMGRYGSWEAAKVHHDVNGWY